MPDPRWLYFLKRAGFEPEIYEARTEEEGFSLSLSCNGMGVLRELGLDGAVLAEGSPVSKWLMWNGKGKKLGGGVLAGGGLKSVFIKRVPLGRIISEEAERHGIKIVRGKKLENIKTGGSGGVTATFHDGSSANGDILVGCDGIHSRTRQIIDPAFQGAVYTGLINSGGYTVGVKLPVTPETTHFIFCKRAFFGYHVSPTGYIYWFTNRPEANEPARGAFGKMTDEERKGQLLDIFRDDQPFIREIIQTAEATFPYFPSYALPKQPSSWHKGPLFANPKASDWMYSYRVDWDEKVERLRKDA